MQDFETMKSSLKNVNQLARGGQKVVYSANHAQHGEIVIKLFFKTDARSQREIDISENFSFDCVPIIYETGHILYEGADTLYVIEQWNYERSLLVATVLL